MSGVTAMFTPPADPSDRWNVAQRLKCTSSARSQSGYGFSIEGLKQAVIDEMAIRGCQDFTITKKGSMGMFPNGAKTTKVELMRELRKMLESDREIIIAGDRVAVFGRSGQHMGVVQRVWTNPLGETNRGRWGAAGTLWRRIKLDDPTATQKDHARARQVLNRDGVETKIYRIQRAEDTGILPSEGEGEEEGDDAASEAGPGSNSDAMSVASTRAATKLFEARRMMEVLEPLPENELGERELYVEDAGELAGPSHGVRPCDRTLEYGVGDTVSTKRAVRAWVENRGWLGARDPPFVESAVSSGEHGKIRSLLAAELSTVLNTAHHVLPQGSALVRFDIAGDLWLRPCDMSDRNRVDVTKYEPWSFCSCKRRRKEE